MTSKPKGSVVFPSILIGIGLLAASIAAYLIVGGRSNEEPPATSTLNPVRQPDLSKVVFLQFDGDEVVPLSSLTGEPLLLNFFASWCAPCVAEMPEFERVHQAKKGDVRFIGINIRDGLEDAKRLVMETEVSYEILRDPVGEAFDKLHALGMPSTFFFDASGTLTDRYTGQLNEKLLLEKIEANFP